MVENPFSHRRLWGPEPRYPNVESYQSPYVGKFITVAGPCSVESVEQIDIVAKALGDCGINYLRGGVFRAGTYPNRARGFGFIDEKLIAEFARAAHDYGMKCVLEVLDYRPEAMAIYDKYADAYQVGARQMQNYALLDLLSRKKRPVFLKRNAGATIDEFLGSAEYLLQNKMADPIMIERGGSTNHTHVRWDLSISMIPAVKSLTSIPIIVDASHGTGRRDLVEPLTLAGIAAGADGFLVEVHPTPEKSLSDADQAISIDEFRRCVSKARDVRRIKKGDDQDEML